MNEVQFQPGDKVRIVLEGTVKSHAGPGWAVVVEDEDGFTNWDASVVELIERQKLLEGESNE